MIDGRFIYAVDFDGTLSKAEYPACGIPNTVLFDRLKHLQSNGAIIILWTSRCGKPLEDAIKFCKQQGLTFDYVNENVKELIEQYGEDSRKINADVYIDDRAMKATWVNVPKKQKTVGENSVSAIW